mmetsp:Transcript_44170/g.127775  ORF Transcript_44170/g.127775 Transcript_44170/m.127775 type:complete len:200 (+) Transcript_44170:273-872(+)
MSSGCMAVSSTCPDPGQPSLLVGNSAEPLGATAVGSGPATNGVLLELDIPPGVLAMSQNGVGMCPKLDCCASRGFVVRWSSPSRDSSASKSTLQWEPCEDPSVGRTRSLDGAALPCQSRVVTTRVASCSGVVAGRLVSLNSASAGRADALGSTSVWEPREAGRSGTSPLASRSTSERKPRGAPAAAPTSSPAGAARPCP